MAALVGGRVRLTLRGRLARLRQELRNAEDAVNIADNKPGERMKFTRITVDPAMMGGVPCIRGLRIPVATVVGMIADGMATTEILAAYPDLVSEDLAEALRYAAEAVRERELPVAAP